MNNVNKIIRKYYHGLSNEQWEECKDQFPYSSIPHIAKEHTRQCLGEVEDKVKKLQEYYYHNTDEETADIIYKTLEDVLQLIEDTQNKQ